MLENIVALVTEKVIYIALIYISWRGLKFGARKVALFMKMVNSEKPLGVKALALVKTILYVVLFCASIVLALTGVRGFLSKPNFVKSKVNVDKSLVGLSEAKDPVFVCSLGCKYLLGDNVEKNYDLAKKHFETATKLGSAQAFFMLGFMHQSGLGCEIDIKKSLECYHKSAEKNYVEAQTVLGVNYVEGVVVERDIEKGLHYLKLAAGQNNGKAFYVLGALYENGEVIPQNMVEAKKYYGLAAKKNEQKSQLRLGIIFKHEGNFKKAKELFEAAAKQGNIEANVLLGDFYLHGSEDMRNYAKAEKYFRRGARHNEPSALYSLGFIALRGLTEKADYRKAAVYFERAAKYGSISAQNDIALLYITGLGVEKDIEKAKQHLSSFVMAADVEYSSDSAEVLKMLDDSVALEALTQSLEKSILQLAQRDD